jgi:hypothetical protein
VRRPGVTALTRQGVHTLCRLPAHVAVFDEDGRQWEAGALLRARAAGRDTVELAVTLGVRERVPVRLIARLVPPQVAAQRRRRWRREARREGRAVSRARLALADWDAYITTAPPALLAAEEALALARARWQVELLFKLWKQHGRLGTSRSAQPWRVLCEVYAKLLALLIQHWCLLLRCWADPARSLVEAAAVVREYALLLALARGHGPLLTWALTRLAEGLAAAGRVAGRRARPATARHLATLDPPPRTREAA